MKRIDPDRAGAGGGVAAQVWRVDLSHSPAKADAQTLSSAEIERAQRFVFERDRRRYMAAHCALRRLLARHTGRASGELRFDEGANGKPSLRGLPSCEFNLSHTEDVALVALGDQAPIGVDVEMLRPIKDAADLAALHFTSAEQAAWLAAPVDDRDRLFLSAWTRKEACLKAIGTGLSLAAQAVDAGVDAQPRDLMVRMADGSVAVRVQMIDAGSDVVAALACVMESSS